MNYELKNKTEEMSKFGNYKEELKIPKGWRIIKIKDIIRDKIRSGVWGDDINNEANIYPVIRSTEITHEGKINTENAMFRKFNVKPSKIETYKLEYGDILIVASSGSEHLIGRVAFFNKVDRVYLFSNFILRVRVSNDIESKFLFYFLNSSSYSNFLMNYLQTSTGLRNFPKIEFLSCFHILLPPLPEQQKIAEILDTVDNAIEKTDKIIEKYRRIKQGLMHDLLTRGIDENGNIRNEKTHKFKDSPIGRIPEEWEVVKLGEVISLEYGKGLPNERRVNGNYPVYGSNGIVGYHTKFFVKGPGIIVGRKGAMGEISWSNLDFWPIDTSYFVKTNKNDISFNWLFFLLINLDLKRLSLSDIIPGLNRSDVYKIQIPLPPLPEQQRIASILSQIDETIKKETAYKEKLQRLKSGLMEDLLTGKVRVNNLVKEAYDEKA